MAKSMRCKREKRLRSIKRELVQPIYEIKNEAKYAAIEAALNAPKLPVRTPPTSMDADAAATITTSDAAAITAAADMDVEMGEGNQTKKSLKPMGRRMKKKLKLSKKKYRGKGKIRKKNI